MRIHFVQKIIDILRNLKKIKIEGENNKIELKSKKLIQKLLVFGNNNSVQINTADANIKIQIYGNNNTIILEEGIATLSSSLVIGVKDTFVNNATIKIGKNTTSNGFLLMLLENESAINIGEDCLFSENIIISCTDTHAILDENHNVINAGKFIEIGNHVWCGRDARIGKNVKIPANSVIGQGSIVTKCFEQPNIVLAGNPAKIVKENIFWDRRRPSQVLENKTP